jgi:hypothetical protein
MLVKIVLLLAGLLSLTGCGTLHNGRAWGQDATLFPSAERFSRAVVNSAKHHVTWAPLLGAALLSIDDYDEDLSRRLAEDNPVFGSRQDAYDASDTMRDTLVASVFISALATPGGDTAGEQIVNKGKGMVTEWAALQLTSYVTSGIKDITGRVRPNGSNDDSFPSGHASGAFAAAALTSKNLDSLTLSPALTTGIRAGLYTLASGTALARVEAEVHYATDVLVGAALGNFIARVVHDAFLGLPEDRQIQLNISPELVSMQYGLAF